MREEVDECLKGECELRKERNFNESGAVLLNMFCICAGKHCLLDSSHFRSQSTCIISTPVSLFSLKLSDEDCSHRTELGTP